MEQQYTPEISHQDTYITAPPPPSKRRGSFWQRAGGSAFTISLLVHVVFVLLAVFVLYKWIAPPAEKVEQFVPGGGGGGNKGSEASHKIQKQLKSRMSAPSVTKRIASSSSTASFALPDSNAEMMNSGLPMDVGTSSAGSGGGAGGGKGGGIGTGVGSGSGPGSGPGSGRGFLSTSPFGTTDKSVRALSGTFYDMKQTDKKKPTDVEAGGMPKIVREFTNGGWRDSAVRNYYQAQQKLIQTRIYMPKMPADAAPAAFECDKEVQPSRWMVVYRGNVIAPKSGRFRFVGAADDILVVRFNKKTVFDHGWTSGTVGVSPSNEGHRAVLRGEKDDSALEKTIRRDYPMKIPVTYYQYEGFSWNNAIGGLAAGVEFDVSGGSEYELEILISEVPGGSFGAFLLIEEMGATYQKDPSGAPILPLFRMDESLPKPGQKWAAPPFAQDGPIWKAGRSQGGNKFGGDL